MAPSKWQYFVAQNSPFKIWMTSGTLLFAAYVIKNCGPTLGLLQDWHAVLWVTAAIVLSLPLGWLLSLVAGSCVLGPIYDYFGSRNGAPFQIGDQVRILCGPHCDRISHVYSLWQRGSVRVELGEKEKEEYKDIFYPTELLRVHDAE